MLDTFSYIRKYDDICLEWLLLLSYDFQFHRK
jgi:hypothetical protein